MPEETFVGRKKYIKRFEQLLIEPTGTPYILNLRGSGGIGKTKILQHLVELCRVKNISHTGIIDFYNSRLNSQINAVEFIIAHNLEQKNDSSPFARYWQARHEAETARERKDKRYTYLREASKNQFIEDLADWAQQNAIPGQEGVLIFDTFEAIKNNPVGARIINEWLPVLKSATVIISGRQQKDELIFPTEIAPLIVDIPVTEFTKDEAIAYLKKREVWEIIKNENAANDLFKLTEKQPLRLALSADRLTRYNFLNPISSRELVKDAKKADFEQKLVGDLANDIEYPESTIVGAMAHIPRPFDTPLINFLLPESYDQPETILQQLSQLSFVKELVSDDQPRYWLQDEMRFLFHRYVFTDTFTWDERRRDISKKMIAFYNQKIEEAEQKDNLSEKEQLIADRLYHEIYLNSNQNFSKANRDFQAAREAYEIRFANMILGVVQSAVGFLNSDQQFSLELMEARSLRDNDYVEASEGRLLKLYDAYGDQPDRAVYIFNALGGTAERLGELAEAIEYYNKSLQLSEELNLPERLSLEETNIGRVHRRIGNWEAAVNHFTQAYELALAQDKSNQNRNRIADIFLDLGYVYGSQGRHKIGLEYCDEAIKIWEDLNLPQKVAAGQAVRGAVYRIAGQHDEAIKDIEIALQELAPSNNTSLARAYSDLGFTYWSLYNKTKDEVWLKKGQEELEASVAISRDHHLVEELPHALHRLGHVYWDQGHKKAARKINDEAYEAAKRVHDIYFSIHSLVGKAEFDYADGIYNSISDYAQELKVNFEAQGYEFPLLYGRMCRIQANVAFYEKKYEEAINYYAEGLYAIAQHGGYGKYSMGQELDNLEKNLQSLPLKTFLKACQNLKDRWTAKGLNNENMLRMISRLDRLIHRAAFESRGK